MTDYEVHADDLGGETRVWKDKKDKKPVKNGNPIWDLFRPAFLLEHRPCTHCKTTGKTRGNIHIDYHVGATLGVLCVGVVLRLLGYDWLVDPIAIAVVIYWLMYFAMGKWGQALPVLRDAFVYDDQMKCDSCEGTGTVKNTMANESLHLAGMFSIAIISAGINLVSAKLASAVLFGMVFYFVFMLWGWHTSKQEAKRNAKA